MPAGFLHGWFEANSIVVWHRKMKTGHGRSFPNGWRRDNGIPNEKVPHSYMASLVDRTKLVEWVRWTEIARNALTKLGGSPFQKRDIADIATNFSTPFRLLRKRDILT